MYMVIVNNYRGDMDTKKLKTIGEQVIDNTAGIKEANEKVESLKKENIFLTTKVIPSLLGETDDITIKGGIRFKRGQEYVGFIPSVGNENREKAIDYFISKGYGADLDGTLVLEFDGDERDLILKLLNFIIDISKDIDYLEKHDVVNLVPLLKSFYMAEKVHYKRLNSRLGDLYETQEDFDPELFHFTVTEKIKVKKGK